LAATLIIWIALAYLIVGVVFAIAFVVRGAGQVDPAALGAPIGFRVLIFPGSVALWPVLLLKWVRS
jgi:hypothetical protein